MQRSDFIKSIFSLTGTAFIYSCKGGTDELLPFLSEQSFSVESSKEWFFKSYLPNYESSSARTGKKSIERSFNWDKGVKFKNNKEEFVWAPVQYKNNNEFPTLVSWKEGEEYIPKLAEFLKWNIAEGFIVYKNKKGDLSGFLVQVAYDPFKHKMGSKVNRSNYTGMIIHADLNEEPLRAWRFLDGKLDSSFDSESSKGLRTNQCYTTYYSYQTVSVQSCGANCSAVEVTLHQNVYTYCDNGNTGNGSGTSQGYPYYPDGGGYSSSTSTPVYSFYSPYVNYDFNKLARHEGEDYQIFMQKLNRTLDVLNITGISTSIPATYVDVVLKGVGISDASIIGSLTVPKAATSIGWAGVAVGGVQLAIGLSDGDITQNDALNAVALGLGILSVATPVGWIALTAGVTSALISIYTTGNP